MPKKKVTRSGAATRRPTKRTNSARAPRNQTHLLAGSLSRASGSGVMNVAQLSTALVVFLLVNTLITLIANVMFPSALVLGNHLLSSPLIAAAYSMGVVSLLVVGAMPVIESLAERAKIRLNDGHWAVLAWALNIASVRIVAQFAELLGMGISSWKVAVTLGLALSLAQGLMMKKVVKQVR